MWDEKSGCLGGRGRSTRSRAKGANWSWGAKLSCEVHEGIIARMLGRGSRKSLFEAAWEWAVEIPGFPPIRDETANGWGTEHFWLGDDKPRSFKVQSKSEGA